MLQLTLGNYVLKKKTLEYLFYESEPRWAKWAGFWVKNSLAT